MRCLHSGSPRASVTALAELHRLLVEHGHRRSSLRVHHTVGEASHEDRLESSSSASHAALADRSTSAVHDVRGARASFLGYSPIVLSSASQSRGTAADHALKRLAVAGLASHPICTQAKDVLKRTFLKTWATQLRWARHHQSDGQLFGSEATGGLWPFSDAQVFEPSVQCAHIAIIRWETASTPDAVRADGRGASAERTLPFNQVHAASVGIDW